MYTHLTLAKVKFQISFLAVKLFTSLLAQTLVFSYQSIICFSSKLFACLELDLGVQT